MNEVFELQNKLKLKIILLTTKIVIKNNCAFYYYCKSFRQKKIRKKYRTYLCCKNFNPKMTSKTI